MENIKSLEGKSCYFSGSEFSWGTEAEVENDGNYGEFVCTFGEFCEMARSALHGDFSAVNEMLSMSGADMETVNLMIANEPVDDFPA